jgi:hypothetical protein
MGRRQLRLGVWALAIMTCVAVTGEHTALAADGQRVEAAGWYFSTQYPQAPNGSAEIKFGVTGKEDHGNKLGRFEYFNTFTGLKGHGKLAIVTFYTTTQSASMMPIDQCPMAPPPEFGGPPLGAQGVRVQGNCDDGSNCSFNMDLIDGGDPGRGRDWVCRVSVVGQDKNHQPAGADMEDAQALVKGNIKIR